MTNDDPLEIYNEVYKLVLEMSMMKKRSNGIFGVFPLDKCIG
jgi:hypothetical protein